MFRNVVKEQLKVPGKVEYLGELRDFVTKVGKRHGFSERVINAFKLSIDEAATNIIKHAYRDWEGDITIRAIAKKNSLTIVLVDQGKYFDPRQVSSPDLQRYVEIGKKGGLGIFIMRRLLDSIDYRKTEEGNELWLVKNRDEAKKRKMSVTTIPLSLKTRYWLYSVLFFSGILILIYAILFLQQKGLILSEYIQDGRRGSSVLSEEIANKWQKLDSDLGLLEELKMYGSEDALLCDEAQESVNSIKNSERAEILYNVLVVEKRGTILASFNLNQVITESFEIPEGAKKISDNIYALTLENGQRILNIQRPIILDYDGAILGFVHYQINYEIIHKEINSSRFKSFNLFLLVWIIGSASLFFLIYLVMNPFRRLQEWVKALGQPGVAEEMDIDASTEVGEIAQAFSDITIKLRESQENLAEQERLQQEMQVAKEIQQTLLPAEFPEIEGYDISSYYAAAKEVGGDYYDFVEVDKDTLGVVVADVSGKGVPGSLVMTMIRTALRTEARGIKDAAEVLSRVNDFVVNDMKKGMFVTLFYVIIDSKKRRLNFASAGHNPMILYRPTKNKTYYLNPRGFPIGISLPDKLLFRRSLESDTIALAEDDILLVYTDGVTEAMNHKRSLFGEERFLTVIRDNGKQSAEEFVDSLKNEINTFTEGTAQNDDITLVAIKEKTSADKVELERAKKAYLSVQDGVSIKEACDKAGITTYSYYNKYKEKFEKEGIENYSIESDYEQIEAKHLSIEEKTKIYDVIRRFPEYGAKRISEELNTERYEFTQIPVARIYEELVRIRLNTKELREAFILRGDKKKRIKPPGTPMMTIKGKVILQREKFEEDGEDVHQEAKPKIEKPKPTEEKKTSKEKDKEDINIPDVFSMDKDDLLTGSIIDILDKRKSTKQEEKDKEEISEDGIEDFTVDYNFAQDEEEEYKIVDEKKHSLLDESDSDEMDVIALSSLKNKNVEPEEDDFFDEHFINRDGIIQESNDAAYEIDDEFDSFIGYDFEDEDEQLISDQDDYRDDMWNDASEKKDEDVDDDLLSEDLIGLKIKSGQDDEQDQESELLSDEELEEFTFEDSQFVDQNEIESVDAKKQQNDEEKIEEILDDEFYSFFDDSLIGEKSERTENQGNIKEDQSKEKFFEITDQIHEITNDDFDISEDQEPEDKMIEENQKEESAPEFKEGDIQDQKEKEKRVTDNSENISLDELVTIKNNEEPAFARYDEDFDNFLKDAVIGEDSPRPKSRNTSKDENEIEKDNKQKLQLQLGHALEKAIFYYENEQYDDAIKVFQKLVNHMPEDYYMRELLGNAYFRQRLFNKAVNEYEKVINLDPLNENACENLGVAYANQGDLRKAIHQWKRLLRISPHRIDIRKSILTAEKILQQRQL